MVQLSEYEIVRRGQAPCEARVRQRVDTALNHGKMLVLNVETGLGEMDTDRVTLPKPAMSPSSHASLFTLRVGNTTACRVGGRLLRDSTTDDSS